MLLDEPRHRKVLAEAERRHVSVASVIREAIDQLPSGADARRDAIAAILAAKPMPMPANPDELRNELDAAHQQMA